MRREHEVAYRRNARVVATSLPEAVRTEAWSHRFRGRASVARFDLDPAERTRFAGVRAALDMAEGRGRHVGDVARLDREIHEASIVLDQADAAAVRRAVRLLHELVPVGDDVVERAEVIAEMEPVGAAETELWPLVAAAARSLAGGMEPTSTVELSAEMLAADAAVGATLDRVLDTYHPLAALAALHVGPATLDRRRFEATAALFDRCFDGYSVDVDPWTATTDIWDGLYVDTTGLLGLELAAHHTMELVRGGSVRDAQTTWRQEVQPLTRVNAGLRRLERLGAEIGEFLFLPTEPRPEIGRLRPASDLFTTVNLRRLICLGLEVLDDEVEVWGWRNLWARGCRPQACLPQRDELLPFADDRWRVLVPKQYSKTGLVVDYVATPIAKLVGWSPEACPEFERALSARDGRVPTHVAGNACRKVRRAWKQLQLGDPELPDLPDRLSYMTRKLLALWLAQRLPTPALTRWLSHATSATNYTYAKPTIAQLLVIRDRQRGERP